MTDQVKSSPHLAILYDQIRWEEKASDQSRKKRGFDPVNIDCKNLFVDLDKTESQYKDFTIIQTMCKLFQEYSFYSCVRRSGRDGLNP